MQMAFECNPSYFCSFSYGGSIPLSWLRYRRHIRFFFARGRGQVHPFAGAPMLTTPIICLCRKFGKVKGYHAVASARIAGVREKESGYPVPNRRLCTIGSLLLESLSLAKCEPR